MELFQKISQKIHQGKAERNHFYRTFYRDVTQMWIAEDKQLIKTKSWEWSWKQLTVQWCLNLALKIQTWESPWKMRQFSQTFERNRIFHYYNSSDNNTTIHNRNKNKLCICIHKNSWLHYKVYHLKVCTFETSFSLNFIFVLPRDGSKFQRMSKASAK